MLPEPTADLLRRTSQTVSHPLCFSMFGKQWRLLPDVFAPLYDPSTFLFTAWLPLSPGMRFLEIGCGAGITAVMAALRGCDHVTALDINENAVDNTNQNVRLHGVEDKVEVHLSDLFSAVDTTQKYDLIYWNSSFIDVPEDHSDLTPLERAVVDPGYRTHRRFIAEARNHLSERGRILLGFGSLGNRDRLSQLASESSLTVKTLQTSGRAVSANESYQLLELSHSRDVALE